MQFSYREFTVKLNQQLRAAFALNVIFRQNEQVVETLAKPLRLSVDSLTAAMTL